MGYTMAYPLFVAEIRWPAVWVPVVYTLKGSKKKKTLLSRPCPRTIEYGYTNKHFSYCRM